MEIAHDLNRRTLLQVYHEDRADSPHTPIVQSAKNASKYGGRYLRVK